MAGKKKADSYLDTLSPGYESDTVTEGEAQLGKPHEEEVAPKNNWEDDEHNEVGKAAPSKMTRIVKRLRRISREIESMDEEYQGDVKEIVDTATEQPSGKSVGGEEYQGEPEDLDKMEEDKMEEEDSKESKKTDEHIIIEAVHPIEHDPAKDNPEADMPYQTGDKEWIDIGPGEFKDPRNEVGKAATK